MQADLSDRLLPTLATAIVGHDWYTYIAYRLRKGVVS